MFSKVDVSPLRPTVKMLIEAFSIVVQTMAITQHNKDIK